MAASWFEGLKMTEGTRGWQQLTLKPEVWNKHRSVSICANLSSTEGSIVTPRGKLAGSWECITGNGGDCGIWDEHDTFSLNCGNGGTIAAIDFVSFGTPTGSCASGFAAGKCDSNHTTAIIKQACLGKGSCSLPVESASLGGDPCFETIKQLAVKVTCQSGKPSAAKPVFAYTVSIPVGSTAAVVLPQFGSSAASIAETRGSVWAAGAFVPGVAGVTGGSVDADGNVALQVGSGDYTFTVSA